MPLSIFKKLRIGEVQQPHMRLQLANRSIAKPEGKIEEFFVRVDKFLFHTNFVIWDYEANQEISIILRRPFLSTSRVLIDIH